MRRSLPPPRAALVVLIAFTGCHGQFDFDADRLDAGSDTPNVDLDVHGDERTGDTAIDRSRPDIHIACGGDDCKVNGCCSTSSGPTCVNVAAGATCGGLLIQCDDSDDCAEGMVCCAEGEARDDDECPDASCHDPPRVQRVHCEPQAHCTSMRYVVLCNPDRPGPCADCIASTLSGLPPGYHQCADSP
jgi:hypothetical protein